MNSEQFSIGTKVVVDKLEQLITSGTTEIDTVCLNVGTVLRNCSANQDVKEAIEEDKRKGIETTKPAKVLLQDVEKEIIAFIEYTCQLFQNNRLVHNPHLIIYNGDYSKCIPSQVYRMPTPGKRVLIQAEMMSRSGLFGGKREAQKLAGTMCIQLFNYDGIAPYQYIYNELKSMNNNHNLAMISHHPVDYHVGPSSHTFRIIRSYTGKDIEYKQLGDVVFDTPVIPFNVYTHAVLGDKEDIKGTLKPSVRKKLFDTAEKEEWRYKTKDYIRERLYKLGIPVPISL